MRLLVFLRMGGYDNAQTFYKAVFNFAHQYIDDFDIDKDSLQDDITWLRQKLGLVTANSYTDVDAYKRQLVDSSIDIFSDSESHEALYYELLVDAMIGVRLAELMPNINKKKIKRTPVMYTLNGIGTKLYGDTLYFVFLFIPIFPIASYDVEHVGDGQYSFSGKKQLSNAKKWWLWIFLIAFMILCITVYSSYSNSSGNGSNSSSSGGSLNSAWKTCSDEYDSIKSRLDDIESEMSSYKDSGYTEAYNTLVPTQNSLVQQVNDKATECNNLR